MSSDPIANYEHLRSLDGFAEVLDWSRSRAAWSAAALSATERSVTT